MKKFICLIGLVFLFNSSAAFADKDTYFKVSGMISDWGDFEKDIETNTGFGLLTAIGKKFGDPFMVLDYSYRNVVRYL